MFIRRGSKILSNPFILKYKFLCWVYNLWLFVYLNSKPVDVKRFECHPETVLRWHLFMWIFVTMDGSVIFTDRRQNGFNRRKNRILQMQEGRSWAWFWKVTKKLFWWIQTFSEVNPKWFYNQLLESKVHFERKESE